LAILKSQLELWKLVPVLANSPQAALEILSKENRIALVLTDMEMPYMNGIDLAKKVRSRYPALPVILLSSVGENYSKDKSQLFSSILNKPVRQHVLSRHILNALEPQQGAAAGETGIHQKLSANFGERFPLDILVAEDNLVNQKLITGVLN